MNLKRSIAGGIGGTTIMTLFSYMVSRAAKKNFIEPVILSQLLNRITPVGKRNSRIIGWTSHYIVGILFDAIYEEYLELKETKPTLANTFLLGSLSGLAGIAIWHATFTAHPNPPGVDLKNYYKQLFIAHIIFGAGTALTRELLDSKKDALKIPLLH
jgi:hypothetical protein